MCGFLVIPAFIVKTCKNINFTIKTNIFLFFLFCIILVFSVVNSPLPKCNGFSVDVSIDTSILELSPLFQRFLYQPHLKEGDFFGFQLKDYRPKSPSEPASSVKSTPYLSLMSVVTLSMISCAVVSLFG